MAPDHYENFPVASRLLPAQLRPAVVALYRFARSADDLADEGDAPPEARLTALAGYAAGLNVLAEHRHVADAAPGHWPDGAPVAVFEPLRQAVCRHSLPIAPLHHLLAAFRQDVTQHRYTHRTELLHYCQHSADPVGELMLHLYGACTPENLEASHHICTGLQLTNFCQDVAIDQARGRVYLPEEELHAAKLSADALPTSHSHPGWAQVMALQVTHAREHLCRGAPLACRIPGRAGWELRLVVLGGLRILERIEAVHYDVFQHRPTLNWRDWALLLTRLGNFGHFANLQSQSTLK